MAPCRRRCSPDHFRDLPDRGRIDNSGASGFSAFSRGYENGSARTTYSGIYYGVTGLTSIVTTAAGWVFYATAICGLRNRPLEIGWLATRSVIAFVTSILIGIIFVVAAIVAFIVIFIASALFFVIFPPLGVLLAIGLTTTAIIGAFYAAIRIVFVPVAVFDGFGPIEAIQESWRLSHGSVLRMFGWGLVTVLIVIGFVILSLIGSIPFLMASLTPVAQGVSTAITLVGACLIAYLLSVLYESERARKYPNIYGYAQVASYPPYAYPGQYPGQPGQQPMPYPVPAHYYPGQPPMSGWGDPTQPMPAPTPGWGYPPAPAAPQYPPAPAAPQYPPQYPPAPGAPQYPPAPGAPQYPPQYPPVAPTWGPNALPQPPAPDATQVQTSPPADPPANS